MRAESPSNQKLHVSGKKGIGGRALWCFDSRHTTGVGIYDWLLVRYSTAQCNKIESFVDEEGRSGSFLGRDMKNVCLALRKRIEWFGNSWMVIG